MMKMTDIPVIFWRGEGLNRGRRGSEGGFRRWFELFKRFKQLQRPDASGFKSFFDIFSNKCLISRHFKHTLK